MSKLWVLAGLACVIATGLVGCGGGGGGSSSTPSPYAGTFSGTFTTSNGQSGTGSLVVATNGNVSGSIHNNTTGMNGTVTGTIDNSGNVSVVSTYSSGSAMITGKMSLNSTSHVLSGTLTENDGGGAVGTITLQFTEQ